MAGRALGAALALLLFVSGDWAEAASPDDSARFLLEVGGAAVGLVELRVDEAEGSYRYTSTHLFVRGADRSKRVREVTLPLRPPGAAHESLLLWQGPLAEGCVSVRAELEGREGALCVTAKARGRVEGTLHAAPFSAVLDERGRLTRFESRGAVLRRVEGEVTLSARDPFAEGWPVGGARDGGRALRWKGLSSGAPVKSAATSATSLTAEREARLRALSRRVHGSFVDRSPSPADFAHDEGAVRASCLGHARRFIEWAAREGLGEVELVQGVFVEPGTGRAFAHAWVRAGALQLDPTLEVPVLPQTHLALPSRELWPELVSGRLRPVR